MYALIKEYEGKSGYLFVARTMKPLNKCFREDLEIMRLLDKKQKIKLRTVEKLVDSLNEYNIIFKHDIKYYALNKEQTMEALRKVPDYELVWLVRDQKDYVKFKLLEGQKEEILNVKEE